MITLFFFNYSSLSPKSDSLPCHQDDNDNADPLMTRITRRNVEISHCSVWQPKPKKKVAQKAKGKSHPNPNAEICPRRNAAG